MVQETLHLLMMQETLDLLIVQETLDLLIVQETLDLLMVQELLSCKTKRVGAETAELHKTKGLARKECASESFWMLQRGQMWGVKAMCTKKSRLLINICILLGRNNRIEKILILRPL